VRRIIAETRPDIVHVHNTFPLLSPSVFSACRKEGVLVVWTLHNYRVSCANGIFLRNGRPCEDCNGKLPIPAVIHKCYRGSLIGTLGVAAMIGYHQLAGTWRTQVDRFIALSEFSRQRFIAAGIPQSKISTKPNFVANLALNGQIGLPRAGALFVGRLSAEKGLETLIEAWRGLDIPLTIIGDGPQRQKVQALAAGNPTISLTGSLPRERVFEYMARAQALIMPSLCYETFGLTVAEAMAHGTPVIASDIGALSEIVVDDVNGALFATGDADSLRTRVRELFAGEGRLQQLGHEARATYAKHFTPQSNIARLLEIYRETLAQRQDMSE
jgi:glycosyltransferase involved in cell wall biosynthesis